MAEKSFGVKEISFVGSTPKINSLSNLNLNAVNVAISTNATIGGTLSVTGNVSVGGVLTYEDVTNIDSVGLITARSGIVVKDDATFETANSNNIVFDKSDNALEFGNGVKSVFNNNLQIYNDGTNRIKGSSGGIFIGLPGSFQIMDQNFSNPKFEAGGTHAILYSAGVKVARSHENRFEVGNPDVGIGIGATISTIGNAQFVGVVTASSFIGSGANLTGIAVTEAPVTDYTITGDGSHYYFHGGGVDETAGDPDLYLIRGQKYRFNNTTGSGHPFEFRIADGGSAYSNGVSGDDEGVQFFTVPYDAPAKIFYQCTIHGGMVGNIYIRGAGGQNDNIGLTTFSGDITIKSSTPLLRLTDTDTSGPLNVDIESVSGDLYLDTGSIHRDVIISNSGRANEVARFTGDGKVGIGTDNPSTALEVKGDITLYNSNNQGDIFFGEHGDVSDSKALIRMDQVSSTAGELQFHTEGGGTLTKRLTITSDGSTQIASGVLQRRYESSGTAGHRYYTKAERAIVPHGGSGLNFTITGMTQGFASLRFGGYSEGNRVNFRSDIAGYNAGNVGVRLYESNEITNQAANYGSGTCSITVTKNNASYVVNVTQTNPSSNSMAVFYYFESGGYNSVSTLTVS